MSRSRQRHHGGAKGQACGGDGVERHGDEVLVKWPVARADFTFRAVVAVGVDPGLSSL